MQEDLETTDEEGILSLFQHAIAELDRIEDDSKIGKKRVVQQLAKDLEAKIPTDTIAIEIVNQLRGRVSDRFVRECLDQKYKQEHRVKNAKKQKKDLAAPPPLSSDNLEHEKIVMDTSGNEIGRTQFYTPEDSVNQINDSSDTNNCCLQCSKSEVKIQELEEALRKASFATGEKIERSKSNPVVHEDGITDFEFCLDWEPVRRYMNVRFESGHSMQVWFSGELDRKTGKIISAYPGRIVERQGIVS